MVLSNAERQARYRERLKSAAAASRMSEAQASLLQSFRRRIRETEGRIALMREGRLSVFEITAGSGRLDLTEGEIERLAAAIAEQKQLLDLYDPDGATALDGEDPVQVA